MLLDTNAMIWFVQGSPRLRSAMHTAIADPTIPIYVSLLTFWEMAIKNRKGKLPLPAPFDTDPEETFQRWCKRAAIDIVPIRPAHIGRAMRLAFANDDPFDRMIAATALVEGHELVTSDAAFLQCPGLQVLKV